MTRARPNRSGFEQRLLATLRGFRLSPGQRLTIGFSGGSDSLSLAAGLKRIAPLLDLDLLLVHVDHQLRKESAADALACQQLATSIGLRFEAVQLAPDLRQRTKELGLEEVARRERFQALAAAAANWESTLIALGHHANDQAETVLMHLFRGSGLDGLVSMKTIERRRVPWWIENDRSAHEVTVLRPLLAETRSSIEEYLAATGLQPVDDKSNSSLEFDRNWVRHQVLPAIVERWPSAVESIQRSSFALALDGELLEHRSELAFETVTLDDGNLSTEALSTLERAIAFRVLKRWLKQLGLKDIGIDVVARIYDLALSQSEVRSVQIGAGQTVVVADRELTTFNRLFHTAAIDIPLHSHVNETRWDIQFSEETTNADAQLLLPESLTLLVRTLQDGDCWHGTQRLVTEDLRQSRIHPQLRSHLIALTTGDGVLLIPAIYPNIRRAVYEGPTKVVGVRWNKQS